MTHLANSSAIDTIVQSSTVELLRTHGVAVAPRSRREERCTVPAQEVVGIIRFDSDEIAGHLTLVVPRAVFAETSQAKSRRVDHADWTREGTNQLMGRIKNRLLQYSVRLRVHVPTVLSGVAFARQGVSASSPQVVYRFGALRGEVVVTIDPSLAHTLLEYSNEHLVAPEGELILFE